MEKKCGQIGLDIETYYAGQNQLTHPNVITFNNKWNGYKYYMAYTTYPYANGSEENPCLAGSNDLIHWEKPTNLINPISCCEELECDELKDSHILYREDLDRLEMWYLGRKDSTIKKGGSLHCFRKISQDGVHWGPIEKMYIFEKKNLVSPSIIWENGKYVFWGIRNNNSQEIGLFCMTSIDGKNWSELKQCIIPNIEDTKAWHGTVSKIDNKYCFVWVGNSKITKNYIYYSESKDGILFSAPKEIIENDNTWEYLYRPCLIKEKDVYYCFYGVVREDRKWLVSMSYSFDLDRFKGIVEKEIQIFKQSKEEISPFNKINKIKIRIKKFLDKKSLKLLSMFPVILLVRIFWCENPIFIWLLAIIISIVLSHVIIKNNIKYSVEQGVITGTEIAVIVSFLWDIYMFGKNIFN